MTEQDKNSIGLSFNQRLIKRKRKKKDRWLAEENITAALLRKTKT